MIDILDPNMNLPQPPPADASPVEPVKDDSVDIQDQRLEDKKTPTDDDGRKKKKKKRKRDKAEIGGEEIEAESDIEVVSASTDQDDSDEPKIDILI